MNRRWAGGAILFGWLVALGWLIRREYFRPPSQLLAAAATTVAPGAAYYQVVLGGTQIGYASSKIDTFPDAIRVEDAMLLQIPALGKEQRVDARTDAHLTRSLELTGFNASLRGEGVRFAARGTVVGDSLLSVDIESGSSRRTIRVPLTRPIVLPGLLPLQLAVGGELAVGKTYALRLFDPLLLEERNVHVTVTAESTLTVPDSAVFEQGAGTWVAARWDTIHAWHVTQEVNGIQVQAWIDELGHVVSASSPMGFAMERTAFELAYENFRRRDRSPSAPTDGSDLIRQTAIASNVDLLTEELAELRIRLGGVDLAGFELGGGRQMLVGDTLVVRRELPDSLRVTYRLPSQDPSVAPELRADPLIQSDDPRIQAQAREIVGRERDPRRAAELLTRWVYGAINKQVTVSVPSAVEVLETRRGDCNEHTVLYVALARSVGLPTRTAAGLVYVRGAFYYHAWPEVYLDRWVAVDPTFNQFPADAAHLRFTVGGLARQIELIRLIGRLTLDVVQTRADR